jgi:hypothetical protein
MKTVILFITLKQLAFVLCALAFIGFVTVVFAFIYNSFKGEEKEDDYEANM